MIGCLLLHGFTGGTYEIEPLATYLGERTDWCISMPELRGHGEQLHLQDVLYTEWLDEAEEAFNMLEETCETIYVIGFSMGGMIAAYLAAKKSVDKLVLLAPARRYISFKYLTKEIVEMIGDGMKGKLEENDLYVQTVNKLGDVPIKANIEFMKLVNYTKKYLDDISAPVFIAQGKKDEMVPYQTVYTLEKEIGSEEKEIVFFDNSDHLICLGNDRVVLTQLVFSFLHENKEEKEESV
ncbi:MAG TPA: alpha/beta fold hydrolase [Pseudogracilibacillus sp.]|nr:alpha/beta fold hydrolase [Pseudogracilibacillus sp.]